MLDYLNSGLARNEWTTTHPRLGMDYFGSARLEGMQAEARAQGKELQRSHLDLTTRVIIGKASAQEPVTLYVSLEGSEISSGPMLWDSACRKGFFQTRVGVGLYLTDLRGRRRLDFLRIADGPDTVEGSESTSSAVRFGFSRTPLLNADFFGGNALAATESGLALGLCSARAISRDLRGFRTVNRRPRHGARHEYIMNATSGGAYDTPRDMVRLGEQASFFDFIAGAGLHTPPACASKALPLLSHCVWQAEHDRAIDETIYLNIDLTQTVTCVSIDSPSAGGQPVAETVTLHYRVEEPVPLGRLTAS